MNDSTANQQQLDQRRKLAVQLRADGLTLAEVTRQSGLSAPTVIAAYKAYQAGGWDAVAVKARGRSAGSGNIPGEKQQQLRALLLKSLPETSDPNVRLWSLSVANQWFVQHGHKMTDRSASGYLERWAFLAAYPLDTLKKTASRSQQSWIDNDYAAIVDSARRKHLPVYWVQVSIQHDHMLFQAHNLRKKCYWLTSPDRQNNQQMAANCLEFFTRLLDEAGGKVSVVLKGIDIARVNRIQQWLSDNSTTFTLSHSPVNTDEEQRNTKPTTVLDNNMTALPAQSFEDEDLPQSSVNSLAGSAAQSPQTLTHLQRLEAESIHIMREVIAEADNPVMMYSIGKDSAVMLHLARKAFYPAKIPFPLLHVDTTWKFRAMYEFRDKMVKELGFELLSHVNPEGLAQKVNPFTHGSALHTDIMKTEALKQALDKYQFDVAFGGARRDEEKSRAKERVFSFRSAQHRWEPKNQRPELWNLYNTKKQKGESIRVFPISNWTELDIWQYIHLEQIPIVPLYYSAERPVVDRDGTLIMIDDDRMPLQQGEVPMMRSVRFRTLGCYPLTGAVESTATTLPEIIQEMLLANTSERQGRMIDHDTAASMEKKKQEGYF